jgi:hypothetical protein
VAEEKLEEKTPSKDDPSDSLKKKKKKKKKKNRSSDESLDSPIKKKKKKTRSGDESLDSPIKKKKKKKKKKKVPSEDAKRSEFPVKTWIIRVLIALAVIGGFYKMQLSNQAKAIAKTYMVSLAALNKLQISCTALWSEVGIDKVCDQALAEKAIGKYLRDVKLTVIEGRSHKFRADIQHKKGDKIFRVNKKGDLFLNTNGCLSKLSIMNPDVGQIDRMASTCKTPSS